MHEFFVGVYEDDIAMNDAPQTDTLASSISELPMPSPDSITVTTEFGVVEEPANVTIVSSAGPSQLHQMYNHSSDGEDNAVMTEDLHDDMPPHFLYVNQNILLSLPALVNTTDPEQSDEDEGVNDTGEEGDIDTDDFDADPESAFIEEFIDDGLLVDGVLTPTTTNAATGT
jgi:hypothetical protein